MILLGPLDFSRGLGLGMHVGYLQLLQPAVISGSLLELDGMRILSTYY